VHHLVVEIKLNHVKGIIPHLLGWRDIGNEWEESVPPLLQPIVHLMGRRFLNAALWKSLANIVVVVRQRVDHFHKETLNIANSEDNSAKVDALARWRKEANTQRSLVAMPKPASLGVVRIG